MKIQLLILVFFTQLTSNLFSQSIEEVISRMDSALVHKDTNILTACLHNDLYFGHSNAWIQNKDDVLNDLKNGILSYHSIENLNEISITTFSDHTIRISRSIHVIGKLKEYEFDLQLQVLEIWILEDKKWKLWSRQSVKMH